MSIRDDDLQTAARSLANELALGWHPSPEELLAYSSASLAETERERFAEHLASCPACAQMVIGLAAALADEDPEGLAAPSDTEVAARWSEFRHHLGLAPAGRWPQLRQFLMHPRLAYGVAAAASVAALGLSLALLSLRATVAELTEPRTNVYIGDLEPPSQALRRGEGTPPRISVPATAEHLLLILNLTDPRTFPDYELEIRSAAWQRVWTARGLLPTPDGNFTLEVPRAFLPAGRYHLALFGLERGARTPVANYAFDLEFTSGPP